MHSTKTLSVSIRRPSKDVYEFVRDPENLPRWATAFCRGVHKEGERWIMETPADPVEIRFVERNAFGVLDHYVTTKDGQQFFNPMRAFDNDDGCEVAFTLFHLPGVNQEQLDEDSGMIERDLQTLKTVLEQAGASSTAGRDASHPARSA